MSTKFIVETRFGELETDGSGTDNSFDELEYHGVHTANRQASYCYLVERANHEVFPIEVLHPLFKYPESARFIRTSSLTRSFQQKFPRLISLISNHLKERSNVRSKS